MLNTSHRAIPRIGVPRTRPLTLLIAALSLGASAIRPSSVIAGNGVWTGTGPRAKGIEAIVRDPLNPLRMWSATFGAGVYRSLDGGATWTGYRTGLVNTFVRCVIPEPNHPDSVFCGSNDGVSVSVDGGLTWKKVLSTSQSVRALAIHPVRTGVIYAATFGSGVFKSTNGGKNWSTVNLGLGNTTVRDVVLHPTKPETLLAATATGTVGPPAGPGGLFRSLNGGLSWSQLPDTTGSNNGTHGAAEQIQYDRLDPQRIYVAESDRGVLKSLDGGDTWSRVNFGLTSFRARSLAVVDTLRYVGTVATDSSGAFFTTLNTPLWHLVRSNVTVDALLSLPSAPSTAWAGTDGEGILRTNDRGTTWMQLDGGLLSTFGFSLAVRPSTHAVYVGTGFGDQFWRSTDQGATWTRSSYLFTHDSEHGLAVDPVLANRVYVSAYGSGVYRSDDGGVTFTNPDSVSRSLGNVFVRDLIAWPGQSEHLLVGSGIGPFESTNGGASWSPRIGDLPASFAVHAMALVPGTPFTMYAGSDSLGVYKTTDGGGHWTAANAGLPVAAGRPVAFVHALLVDETGPSVVYASLDTLGCPNCYGVWKSTDAGASWAPARGGLPVGEVRALVQDPVHPATLFCGVDALGVFESGNGGASWVPVANQSGLTDLHIRSLAVDGALSTLYAGTENGVAAITNYVVAGADPAAEPPVGLVVGPTPGRGPVRVSFSLARQGPAEVEVYDVTGARLRTLLRTASAATGRHVLDWDLRTDRGGVAAPGLYFVRLLTDEGVRTARVVRLPR